MRKQFILILVCSLGCALPVAASAVPASPSQPSQAYPNFSAIYDNVGKSVVNITVTQEVTPQGNPMFGNSGDPMFDYFFKRMLPPQQQKYKQRGLGSGFILSADGYILTNAHVVGDADNITVKLNDKREYKAKLVGVDMTSDVAVIKISANNLPRVKIGNPNLLKPGVWVVAIGSPFGLENTITQGIISALSRNLPDDSSVPFIQSDVPINPGNSGGPLINLDGEVVGINSQIYSKSGGYMGISFSIPIDYAMHIAEQLKLSGKVVHGRLGIAIQPVTEDLALSFGLGSARGALVNGVDPDSPAEKAGVRVGDIILKANGREVTDTAILPQIVSNLGPNKEVKLLVWRNNQTLSLVAITVAANIPQTATNLNQSQNKQLPKPINKLGIVVLPLSSTQLRQFGGKISGGLVVQSVSSNAQFAGVASGDIIIGVANTPVTSLEQLVKLVSRYKPGQSLALKILRYTGQQFVTIFVPLAISAAE